MELVTDASLFFNEQVNKHLGRREEGMKSAIGPNDSLDAIWGTLATRPGQGIRLAIKTDYWAVGGA